MSDARPVRVAFFTDSYQETNGIARLSQAFETYAAQRELPWLCVHGGDRTEVTRHGSIERLSLGRSHAAIRLEHDLAYDPLLWRHAGRVRKALELFRPDVLHVTGPSDIGQLGGWLGHRMSIPMAGSWHTNLHEYLGLRGQKWFRWIPSRSRARVVSVAQRKTLDAALAFYRVPRVLLAPNDEIVSLLSARTGRPAHLMRHGVDTSLFTPARRTRAASDPELRIGFVGRLSAEKDVRLLAAVAQALAADNVRHRFVIVGEGAERAWLEREMPSAEFTGILRGEALAAAYANFDLFAFPSRSETFGLAVLEALASGVPVLAMAHGGPRFYIEHGVSGWLANDARDFVDAARVLARDADLRRRLACRGRAVAQTWSWNAVFDRVYEIYRSITKTANDPGTIGPRPRPPAGAAPNCADAT
jgi:glycosyltransferase involved in cell wall biosynthesis